MRWFSKTEFDKVRKLIDSGNNTKAIGDWYWSDFKNNATTLAMAYIYAVINSKCTICTKKLKSILTPKNKNGPLEYNDVVSEIWHHDNTKAIKSLNILVDNGIPFEVKDGDVALEFFTNPKLTKIKDAIEKNPRIISKYMKESDLKKIQKILLDSDDYEMVVTGMSQTAYKARNTSIRAYAKKNMNELMRKTTEIKNTENRKKYIKEKIFYRGNETVENLFNVLLELYTTTSFTVDDIVDILKGLKDVNNANGTVRNLFYMFHKEGHGDKIREITENWNGNLWFTTLAEINLYANDAKLNSSFHPDWIIDYFDLLDKQQIFRIIPKASEIFVNAFIEKYPDALEIIMSDYPDKLPKVVQDVFLF